MWDRFKINYDNWRTSYNQDLDDPEERALEWWQEEFTMPKRKKKKPEDPNTPFGPMWVKERLESARKTSDYPVTRKIAACDVWWEWILHYDDSSCIDACLQEFADFVKGD